MHEGGNKGKAWPTVVGTYACNYVVEGELLRIDAFSCTRCAITRPLADILLIVIGAGQSCVQATGRPISVP